MDAVAIDSIAALQSAGEGRFEWVRGRLLNLGLPSDEHDDETIFLVASMRSYAEETDAGRVKGDGYAERLEPNLVRIPDVAFFKKANLGRMKPTHSEGGADFVIEIVSSDSRTRDRVEKREEYERAGIEEYWIIDPARLAAEFYRLEGGAYRLVSPDEEGKVYSSALEGFFIRVEWLWNRPKLKEVLRELGVL